MRARWRFLGPPTEHVTFLPSQLQPDTDIWLVLLLPEKGDVFKEVRESAHAPSHRWHWQLCSMCGMCQEQEMAFSRLLCFWCVNGYSSSLPGGILYPGWGCSVGRHLTEAEGPEVLPENIVLEDCELSVSCWEISWKWGSSLKTEQSNPEQCKIPDLNNTYAVLQEISFHPWRYNVAKLWCATSVLIYKFSTQTFHIYSGFNTVFEEEIALCRRKKWKYSE